MKMFFQCLAPELTNLSLSQVSCFEFTSRVATMDSIESVDSAKACTHPPMVSLLGEGFSTTSFGDPFHGNLRDFNKHSNGFQKDYMLDCLWARLRLEHLGLATSQFQILENKKRREERMKGKMEGRGLNEGSNGQYFLLPKERTKQPQQSGCFSTLLIWLCITCCCGRYFIASSKFATLEMNK